MDGQTGVSKERAIAYMLSRAKNDNNNLLQVPRGATDHLSFPEAVSHCAAIQCGDSARQLSTKGRPLVTNATI